MKNIILIAPQSAGKGTQATLIKDKYNIPHISMGDLLRSAKNDGTERAELIISYLNQGKLVPQDIVDSILEERLNQNDCQNGYILDGYPRTMEQALAYDNYLKKTNTKISYVINLDVPKEEVLKRITGRRICSNCGLIYNINYETQRPIKENTCNNCKSKLIIRSDDNEDAITKRLNTYYKETEPLLKLYEDKQILYKVDGTYTPDKVFESIKRILND